MKNISDQTNHKGIPLYVGITGHRDLIKANEPILLNLVTMLLAEKKHQCPNTPVILLTQLAEGADRIAAQAALDCNLSFIAVLPFPEEEYKKDFRTDESKIEFTKYLHQASEIIEMPLKTNEIIDREEQYFQSGFYIVNQCHYLIALWDGKETHKKGGTSHIFKLKQDGLNTYNTKSTRLLQQVQTGPIFHIVTPRLSNPALAEPFSLKLCFPLYLGKNDSQAKERDNRMLQDLENYNKDIREYNNSIKNDILYQGKLTSQVESTQSHEKLESNDKHFCIADKLSLFYQKKYFLSLRILLLLVVSAFIFLQVYLEFLHKEWILFLYPALMGLGAIYFLFAKRLNYQNKYEDYRAFAEALRIQFYLLKADSTINVSNFYMIRHRAELEWVIYSLKASSIDNYMKLFNASKTVRVNILEDLGYVKENWIKSQLEYFEFKSIKHNVKHIKYKKLANIFFVLAILSACCILAMNTLRPFISPKIILDYQLIHSIVISITHISLVLSAALHGFNEKMLFSEQSKSYQKMAQLFRLAEYKVNEALSQKNDLLTTEIINELAQEALLENADWILLHRSRPLELPKG